MEPIKTSIDARAWGLVKDTPLEITDFAEKVEVHGAVSLIIKKFLKYGPEYFNK